MSPSARLAGTAGLPLKQPDEDIGPYKEGIIS